MTKWILLAPLLAGAALAQQPQNRPPRGSDNWAAMQKMQSWATAKLNHSPRRHEWVTIADGSRTIQAFVTYPQNEAKAPVVLVLHEVFGLTDSTRNTADEIAAMGYITIAPDMVSGLGPNGGNVQSFKDSHETSNTMTTMPDAMVNAAITSVAQYGLALPQANGKLAIVGLSWGGGATFRYAAYPGHLKQLEQISVFYDVGPPTQTQGPKGVSLPPVSVDAINVPVYGFYGSLDTRVMKSLDATKATMASAHKDYEPVVYEGAEHAFMRVGEDPGHANSPSAAAVAQSQDRLREVLKKL